VIHIRAGKTARSRRTVPLTTVARDALGVAGAPEALVFPSGAGTPINPRNLLRAWHEFSLEVLGRRTSFHSLRHSAATLMLGQGVPLRTISDLLGHSSISITSDVYVETVDALKAEAAARMNGIFGNAET
jgi:integrase